MAAESVDMLVVYWELMWDHSTVALMVVKMAGWMGGQMENLSVVLKDTTKEYC